VPCPYGAEGFDYNPDMHALTRSLLRWYASHKRRLPWRGPRDPYAIWVSEVMLQQTRVETVVPYYRAWMRRFPSVSSLAKASETEVLRLWEGLGYYRRAAALREGARQVMEDFGGRLPQSTAELRRLPGIGPYTAAAIAALAFGEDEIALDGNLRRVLARWMDLETDARTSEGEARLRSFARRLLPPGRSGDFNQALMDLGSQVCLPLEPRCDSCPVRVGCRARRAGTQGSRPVRKDRRRAPHRLATAGVLRQGRRVLIARRPRGGLLGGLWEFPGGKRRRGETPEACLRRELLEELGVRVTVGENIGQVRHAYSHFTVTVHAFECRLTRGQPAALEHDALRWVTPSRLARYPMGKVARSIARSLSQTRSGRGRER
jgi:A/G-specific adenine glycosylase